MSASAATILFAYLHSGDLTLGELLLVLAAMLAAPALPLVLIGVFVWTVARPKEKMSSLRKTDADGGRE